jgi:hypothetical protein
LYIRTKTLIIYRSAWKVIPENFGFIAFSAVRMQILYRSPRERREVDFRSCASKPRLLDVVLRPDGLKTLLLYPLFWRIIPRR